MKYFKSVAISILLFATIGVGVALFIKLWPQGRYSLNKIEGAKHVNIQQKSSQLAAKPENILVLGIDQRKSERSRSDTISVYRLDPAGGKVSVLAVPRDTYVQIPGRKMDKINHAYAFGGINLSKQTLERFLGVQIDHYVIINFNGFVKLIDKMGGIDVFVEKDVKRNGTDIKKGFQTLDGQRALVYVRDREDPMGDIARIKRQQKFMKALALEITNHNVNWELFMEIRELSQNVDTDLSLAEIKILSSSFRKMDFKASRMDYVPGDFYNLNGISYWKPDINKTQFTVQRIFKNPTI